MRALTVLSLVSASFALISPMAQVQGAPQTAQGNAPRVHVEVGGVSEMMESIVVSAKPQAPFTLTLETEWVRMLGDDGTITSVNKRRIARDAAGRVYQERWFLVPKNGNVESQMTTVQIADPNARTLYNCFFVGAKKNICELKTYIPMTPAVNTTGKTVSGDLPERIVCSRGPRKTIGQRSRAVGATHNLKSGRPQKTARTWAAHCQEKATAVTLVADSRRPECRSPSR